MFVLFYLSALILSSLHQAISASGTFLNERKVNKNLLMEFRHIFILIYIKFFIKELSRSKSKQIIEKRFNIIYNIIFYLSFFQL